MYPCSPSTSSMMIRRQTISVHDLLNHTSSSSCTTQKQQQQQQQQQALKIKNDVINKASQSQLTSPRGPWRIEEDRKLRELVKKFGACHWSSIAQHLPHRSGKQARERWINQLNPQLKKKNWTAQEDRLILNTHLKLGNKWSTIANMLPGRTDNAVKNRYNSTLKRAIRDFTSSSTINTNTQSSSSSSSSSTSSSSYSNISNCTYQSSLNDISIDDIIDSLHTKPFTLSNNNNKQQQQQQQQQLQKTTNNDQLSEVSTELNFNTTSQFEQLQSQQYCTRTTSFRNILNENNDDTIISPTPPLQPLQPLYNNTNNDNNMNTITNPPINTSANYVQSHEQYKQHEQQAQLFEGNWVNSNHNYVTKEPCVR